MQRQGNKTDGDQAAANYFEFLTRGRRILLEDTAILQDAYSEHRLFNLPCFKLPAEEHARTVLQQKWADYKAEVIAAHGRSLAVCPHVCLWDIGEISVCDVVLCLNWQAQLFVKFAFICCKCRKRAMSSSKDVALPCLLHFGIYSDLVVTAVTGTAGRGRQLVLGNQECSVASAEPTLAGKPGKQRTDD